MLTLTATLPRVSGCMRGPSSWKDLRKVYLTFLSVRSVAGADLWQAVWQRFVEHPYFRRRARQIARTTLRPLDRTASNEAHLLAMALMIFAKRLRSHCHSESIQHIRDDFRGWLTSALVEDCQSALFSMPRCARQPHRQLATDSDIADAIRIRAHAIVATLADPQRSVLLLYLCGLGPSKIAEALDLRRSQVDRLIRSGVELVRWQLRRRR